MVISALEKLNQGRRRGSVREGRRQLVTLNIVVMEDPTVKVLHEHLDQVRERAMGTSAGGVFQAEMRRCSGGIMYGAFKTATRPVVETSGGGE